MTGKVQICGIEGAERPRLQVVIAGIDDPDYLRQLNIELQTLLLTRRGTLPGSRDYGLRQNFLDYVTPASINQMGVELSEAIDRWVPDVRLQGLSNTADELGSVDQVTLMLELREDAV